MNIPYTVNMAATLGRPFLINHTAAGSIAEAITIAVSITITRSDSSYNNHAPARISNVFTTAPGDIEIVKILLSTNKEYHDYALSRHV